MVCHFLQGDTHLGAGLDTNGSTESFELVTDENNGEGKGKTDGRSAVRDGRDSQYGGEVG